MWCPLPTATADKPQGGSTVQQQDLEAGGSLGRWMATELAGPGLDALSMVPRAELEPRRSRVAINPSQIRRRQAAIQTPAFLGLELKTVIRLPTA
jgi:hypothetical protein